MNKKYTGLVALVFLAAVVFAFPVFCGAEDVSPQPEEPVRAKNAPDYYYHAKELELQGKIDEAISELKMALRIDPNFGKAHLMLGVCYSRKNWYTPAIAEFEKSIALGMDNYNMAAAHHNIGAMYRAMGMHDKADPEFREALRLEPNLAPSKRALHMVGRVELVAFAVFLVFVLIMVHNRLRENRSLKKLAQYLNVSVPFFAFYPSVKGEYQGTKFSLRYYSLKSGTYLEIFFEKGAQFRLSVYKESCFSRLGERLGVVREVKTGDESFDKEFLIFSNNNSMAVTYLISASVKGSIRELFNMGFGLLQIDGRKIFIRRNDYTGIPERALEPQGVVDILQKLSALTRGL